MGIKISRTKPRNILLSLLYRIHKLLPLSAKTKFRLYLDLEWIFDRLAHETSFKIYSEKEHPVRTYSKEFILKKITNEHNVLDLGCKYGQMSNYLAEKSKMVVGIDFDEAAIKVAQNSYHHINLKFEVGEASQYLETQTAQFDVLILSHILEHIDQPKIFLSKFTKHFKYIYIEVPDFDKHFLNHYRQDENIKLNYTDDDHVSEFDRYELRTLIKECNLSIIEEEYIFGVQKIWCEVK